MKTFIRIALILVLPGFIAYPASAWYLGRQVEIGLVQPTLHLQSVPYVRVVTRDYRRGLFSSDETVILELFGDMTRLIDQAGMQKTGSTADELESGERFRPIRISVRSHIKHGPLPDGKTFAAAIVESELDLDERIKPGLAKVLGGKKLLTAHSVYGFGGEGESIVASPAFVIELPGMGPQTAGRIAWEGVHATIRFTKDLGSYSITGEAPKLDAAVTGGRMIVAGMRFATESKRIFADEPLFYSGNQQFSVARASIDAAALGKAIELKQLTYDVSIPVNGDFIDIIAKVAVQEIVVGKNNFGPAHYDLSLKRLHARTVAQLEREVIKVYSDPAAMDGTKNPAEAFGPLAQSAMKLLGFNPEISLDRMSFTSAQGEVLVAARAKFKDVTPEDFRQTASLIAKLDASADVMLPEGLVTLPWGIKAGSAEAMQMRQEQLAALAGRGYIQRKGPMISATLEFSNGQFNVNRKPFDSRVLQVPPTQSGRPAMHRDPAKSPASTRAQIRSLR